MATTFNLTSIFTTIATTTAKTINDTINTTTANPKHVCEDYTQKCTNHSALGTLWLPILPGEDLWRQWIRGIVYFLALVWFFIGVAIASDIFMNSIEYIISKSKTIPFDVGSGGKEFQTTIKVNVRVWNPTVANLTLMALGSSAPEILLSVIETLNHEFVSQPGDLGPGTIVGSAAFNLLFITAVCVIGVPRGEIRRIDIYNVFIITTLFSLFAYLWLWLVLEVISKDVVELWEALVTLFCFPGLVMIAWWADNQFCFNPRKNLRKSLVEKATEIQREMDGGQEESATPSLLRGDENPLYNSNGEINSAALLSFYKEIRGNAELTDEEAASLVAYKLVQTRRHSRLWYRMGACRALMGSVKLQPALNEKLQQVFNMINDFEKKRPSAALTVIEVSPEMLHKKAIFDFQAASFSVPENIGTLTVTILRTGRVDNEVTLRVLSIEGTAKEGSDYEKVDVKVVFEPFVNERTVDIKIIDDNQAEPDESFFLRLTVENGLMRDDAMLGPTHTMEITIVDDDNPGTISFAKRGMLVSETTRQVDVEVVRTNGADGIVSVKWKTVPDPMGGVKHPTGMVGKLTFQHGEKSKLLHIPLFQDNNQDRSAETFDVFLTETEGRALMGKMVKASITISDDAAFQDTVNKVVELAAAEMEIISAHNTIGDQLIQAFKVGDDDEPTRMDYVMHLICLPWKVLLALIPPPSYLGGWLCFLISLFTIGVLTAVIGDIATVFGCIVGLKPTITAITFVALGTSLPDTFASMAAAKHDDTADNAIGNVTGSNSVNVFLGLGLPWTMATIFHAVRGTPGGYNVPAGSLGFSVLVYSAVAIAAVGLLTARRFLKVFGKAELGGSTGPKIITSLLLVGLWLLYVTLSSLEAYTIIKWVEHAQC